MVVWLDLMCIAKSELKFAFLQAPHDRLPISFILGPIWKCLTTPLSSTYLCMNIYSQITWKSAGDFSDTFQIAITIGEHGSKASWLYLFKGFVRFWTVLVIMATYINSLKIQVFYSFDKAISFCLRVSDQEFEKSKIQTVKLKRNIKKSCP